MNDTNDTNGSTAMLQTPAPHTVASTPPLIARLVQQHGAVWLNAAGVDGLAALEGDVVLLIAGDAQRFPECLDVAVVLPELQRAFPGRLRIAVAEADSEDALARRYGATRRPSLVFLRGGQYVTTVAGMLDWDDYLAEVAHALHMPVTRAPGIGIAVVAADSGCR